MFRLLRIVRVLQFAPELQMMVNSMIAALRSVSTTFVLALGIMYVFAILLTMWAKAHIQKYECEGFLCVDKSFGTLARSFLTLMQILCFDNTFSLIRVVLK